MGRVLLLFMCEILSYRRCLYEGSEGEELRSFVYKPSLIITVVASSISCSMVETVRLVTIIWPIAHNSVIDND